MIGNFMIFGDSYSTHKGSIPDDYGCYYCEGGRTPEEPVTNMKREQTWWGRILKRLDVSLVRNDSWSGSTLGYTGYKGSDCSATSSFICRYRKLLEAGFFAENKLDTIFVFGGTNDSWSDAPLGEEKYADWQESDLYSVLPAICYFMHTLRENHPDVRIIFLANCDIKAEVVACIQNAAERYGVEVVTLGGIDKERGHPTVLGMEQICEQVLEQLGE